MLQLLVVKQTLVRSETACDTSPKKKLNTNASFGTKTERLDTPRCDRQDDDPPWVALIRVYLEKANGRREPDLGFRGTGSGRLRHEKFSRESEEQLRAASDKKKKITANNRLKLEIEIHGGNSVTAAPGQVGASTLIWTRREGGSGVRPSVRRLP